MFRPSIIALDYETALLSGEPSLEYYRPDFRVTSCAMAWVAEDGSTKTRYVEGEGALLPVLERIRREGIPVVVHNLPFEFGVTLYRFPGTEGIFTHDTMRLVQVADNGGKEAQRYGYGPRSYADQLDAMESEDAEERVPGLSLVAAASRWLPAEYHNHKDEAHDWLRANGVKSGQEGRNLNALPPDILRRYNVADAVVALRLYETLTASFETDGYDYRLDHSLYLASAKRIAEGKGRGVRVDRAKLAGYREEVLSQIDAIEARFRQAYAGPIGEIEAEMREAYVMAVKTPRGQAKRLADLEATPDLARFNVGSNKQLASLFIDRLKARPKFWTEESKASKGKRSANPDLKEFQPSPSFKAAHLPTYGEGGELLVERRKRLLVLKQCESLLALSGFDGRWHVDLKACGTTTGRAAGGSHG